MRPEVLLMVLVAASVMLWPGGRSHLRRAQLRGFAGRGGRGDSVWSLDRARRVLDEDPVELARRWWIGRRSRRADHGDGLDEAVLALLDAIEPGLRAGLTPGRALALAVSAAQSGSANGSGSGSGSALEGLVREAQRASESGGPVGRVWQRWAEDTGSSTLAFVAAAWQLSERTGAPLAEAMSRAAARTRSELSRRRRAVAAVAGPRATVNVLTALPLVGPLFGLASGLDPAEVYASSPLIGGALVVGVGLLLMGRWWCRRLVASVLEPT